MERRARIKLVVDDSDVKRAEASVVRLRAAGASATTGNRAAADLANFTKTKIDATDAAGAIQKFSAASAESATAAGGLSAALGPVGIAIGVVTVAAGAGVLALIKLAVAANDLTRAFAESAIEAEKFSKLSGFTTQSISALGTQAVLAGEKIEVIRAGMAAFSQIVQDAAAGSKDAAETLSKFGLEGRKAFENMDGAFEQVMRRIADMPDGWNKNRAAAAAFGSEGAKLIPIIEQFGGSLDHARAESDRFATTLDGTATRAARDYQRAVAEMELQMRGLQQYAGTEFAPVIADFFRSFNEFLQNNRSTIRWWIDGVVTAFDSAAYSIRMNIAALKDWSAIAGGDFSLKHTRTESAINQAKNQIPSGFTGQTLSLGASGNVPDFSIRPSGGGGRGPRMSAGPSMPAFGSLRDLRATSGNQNYDFLILEAAKKYNIDPNLLFFQIKQESINFRPSVISGRQLSPAGAVGISQWMPETARRFGVNPLDVRSSVFGTARVMAELSSRFGGGESGYEMALAGYNAGWEGRAKFPSIEARLNALKNNKAETGNYVRTIIGNYNRVRGKGGSSYGQIDPYEMAKEAFLGRMEILRADGFGLTGNLSDSIGLLPGGAITERPTLTTDQIEALVKLAPNLIGRTERDIAGDGMTGDGADAELMRRLIELKKQALNLDAELEEIDMRRLRLKEIENNQEAVINKLIEDRRTAQSEALKAAELEISAQAELFKNDAFRREAQDTRVLEEKVRLNQQIFDLENAIATQGANSAERYKTAWLGAIYEVREANISAVEEQIRAQVRIADQATLHVDQVRARVLTHLANQKTLSEAMADGIIGVFEKSVAKMNERLGRLGDIPILGDLLKFGNSQAASRLSRGLLDVLFPGSSSAGRTQNPIAAPIVDKLNETNQILRQLGGISVGSGGRSGGGGLLPGIFGTGGAGGGIFPGLGGFPGGTAPYNPGDPGTANAGGPLTMGDRLRGLFSTREGGIFAPRQNVLTGQNSRMAGIIGGAGDLVGMLGGMIGGRTGGILSSIGSGASIGSMFGPWGAAIGAGIGAIVGFLGGDPKRRQDKRETMPQLEAGFSQAMQQLRDLLTNVRTLQTDPESAISQATEIRSQIAGGFGLQFLSKKYRAQAQTKIAQRLTEADAIIEQIRQASDVARGAADRRQRIVAEFAGGVFIDQQFKRRNGMLGGVFTGRDTLPSLLAPGELVLNPAQQYRVRQQAGFDVFQGAGIPNYPNPAGSAALASGGVAGGAAMVADDRPIELTIVLQGDTFDDRAQIYQQSDGGRRVLVEVVKQLRKDGDL